jgi:WD40 repeat protein
MPPPLPPVRIEPRVEDDRARRLRRAKASPAEENDRVERRPGQTKQSSKVALWLALAGVGGLFLVCGACGVVGVFALGWGRRDATGQDAIGKEAVNKLPPKTASSAPDRDSSDTGKKPASNKPVVSAQPAQAPIDSESFPGFIQPTATGQFAGHDTRTNALVFSADGKYLASAGEDQLVKLWDVAAGKEKARFKGHKGEVNAVVFAARGKLLVSGGEEDRVIRLWDIASVAQTGTLEGHDEGIRALAIAADGKTLASASHDNTVKLWNLETRQEIASFRDFDVKSVAVVPDGTAVVSAGRGLLVLREVASGKVRQQFKGHTGRINAVALSHDGKLLASGGEDETCRVWDVTTGKEKFRLVHDSFLGPSSLAFSPDSNLLAVSGHASAAVSLLDLKTGKGGRSFDYQDGNARSLVFSPDGAVLALTYRHIHLMSVNSLTPVSPLPERLTLRGHASEVRSLAISPDGKTLASGGYGEEVGNNRYKGVIKLWDIASGQEKGELNGHGNSVLGLAFTPDGKMLVSGSVDQTVKVWDLATGKDVRTLKGHSKEVWPVAVSPDGTVLASGGYDHQIMLWDLVSGKELRALPGHRDTVTALAFSPDGSTLASGSMDRTVKLWSVATGKELATLEGHKGWLVSVAFTPDGKTLASGSWYDMVKLWSVATFKERATIKPGTVQGTHLRFSKDGRLLVMAGPALGLDGVVSVWDMTTGRPLTRSRWKGGLMWSLASTPDATIIATGFGRDIKLWSAARSR